MYPLTVFLNKSQKERVCIYRVNRLFYQTPSLVIFYHKSIVRPIENNQFETTQVVVYPIYFLALAIADTITAFTMILLWGGPKLLGADKPPFYPILYPINWISYSSGIYLTVLLTLERYYAVCIIRGTPNLKKTKIVIVCVCIFAILYNLPHFFEETWDSEGI